jgi:hypothetical protein
MKLTVFLHSPCNTTLREGVSSKQQSNIPLKVRCQKHLDTINDVKQLVTRIYAPKKKKQKKRLKLKAVFWDVTP